MDFLTLANTRYSCRKFSDRPVMREDMEKILSAGIAAPTATNTQSFKLWLLDSPEAKEMIHQFTAYTFGAERFILLGSQRGGSWTRSFDQKNYSEIDAAIVGTHIMLETAALGLATTWVGCFDAPKLQALYPQMAEYELIALFPIGYAAEDAAPAEAHYKRKSMEELVEHL